MKRPEKKERNPNIFALYDTDIVKESHAVGYNQACDEHTPYITYLINRIEDLEHKLEYQRIRPNNA